MFGTFIHDLDVTNNEAVPRSIPTLNQQHLNILMLKDFQSVWHLTTPPPPHPPKKTTCLIVEQNDYKLMFAAVLSTWN